MTKSVKWPTGLPKDGKGHEVTSDEWPIEQKRYGVLANAIVTTELFICFLKQCICIDDQPSEMDALNYIFVIY